VQKLDGREERFIIIGNAAGGIVLVVVCTERQGRIRIISARRHNMSKTTTPSKGRMSDPPRSMSAADVERAARADRDAQPLTAEDLKRMKRTPQVKIIRALELTQEEFAARYHIPLGTLRDWEQGRAQPDQPTRAYLTLIARDPERVSVMLNAKTH